MNEEKKIVVGQPALQIGLYYVAFCVWFLTHSATCDSVVYRAQSADVCAANQRWTLVLDYEDTVTPL